MKKTGKKIVFFIVEGITDKISLENIVDTLVDEYNSSTIRRLFISLILTARI